MGNNLNVLVTGIGGNVAEGILRTMRKEFPEIQIIGIDINDRPIASFLCDAVYKVPYSWEDNYISMVSEICKKNRVELIIPSTDHEIYYLKLQEHILPTIAGNNKNTAKLFLDKWLTSNFFTENKIPFAPTILAADYKGEFSHTVLKPREGKGSRNILYNELPENLRNKNYIVQQLYYGVEITTAFYVLENRKLHGHITMERILKNGTTVSATVTRKYDGEIEMILQKLNDAVVMRGANNMQSIVTDAGKVMPFEVNGRISGTNSIRANFGFEDVKYTIQDFLLHQSLAPVHIKPGTAIRMMLDVIFTETVDFASAFADASKFYYY
jgi:carbamoyl-phosphate synthase large subunit